MTLHTLLFTDVVDSTLLVERLGDARAAQVWAEHDRRARELMVRHHGREIDRTDGFFLLFDVAADAARYALAYHDALRDLELGARVGIHVGDVTLRKNTADDIARGAKRIEVEGLAKPFAARAMALARGGQTLLSAAARGALGTELDIASGLESHGHYRLKGIETPVEIFEVGLRASCAFTPPSDADKAYRVVRAGDLWRPLRDVRHNLAPERDAFIGRTTELRALAQRLDAGARLLNVLGPGGTGKTRFVRRYGLAWLGDWPGGIYFCDLSEARSLDGVYFAAALALGVPLGKGDPGVQLGHAIAGRGRCLVILDNFEQVLAHAPPTLGRWLDRAADAAFVVTSRERLHLPGEEVVPLEPFPLGVEALELFAVRARAQRPDFVLGAANRAAVVEVVRLLDGLPLAIELAAARVRVLSPAQLVERMRDRFALLAGARGPAARQATLRAAIDWSWDLLTAWEQAALAQCSVFEGGFTLEAAEAVLDLSTWPDAPSAMDAVQALVDKSLLRTWSAGEPGRFDLDEPYFGMYLSIHEYAAQKCQASGPQEERQAQRRHGEYFAGFGSEAALEALRQSGGSKRRRSLALELDNLVSACRRAVGQGLGDTAVAAYRATWAVLETQGPFTLAAALGEQVLALDVLAAGPRAAARIVRASTLWRAGRMDEAAALYAQALDHAREQADRRAEGLGHGNLGVLRREQGRIDDARAHLEAALAIHREVGNARAEGTVLGNLGSLHYEQGRIEQAVAHHEAALVIHRAVGNRPDEGSVLGNLGNVRREQGRTDEALALYDQALAVHREVGSRRSEGNVLGNLAGLEFELGRVEAALAHYQAALAVIREVGNRRDEGFVLGNLGVLLRDQGRAGEARQHCEQALAIHREVGNRRFEGIVLGDIGTLHRDQGRHEAARDFYELSLAIDREVGDRSHEGGTLGCLAELLLREGQVAQAGALLAQGEALLRAVGYQLELGKLLCTRGRADAAGGDKHRAGAALAEAEALATAFGASPESELRREIDKLRKALA